MKLVREYTNIPVPKPVWSKYRDGYGEILMTFIPGIPLDTCWDRLNDSTKERLCRKIWEMVEQLRQIPKPEHLKESFLCYTDGTCSKDVLIAELEDPPRPLTDNEAVRERICQRYYHFNGRRYTIDEMYNMLPHSDASVFTHADLATRNIMVDENTYQITGVIDWERAGWYPDYWEYANIWKPSEDETFDWQRWMDCTRPQKWREWDIRGIEAARRVLF